MTSSVEFGLTLDDKDVKRVLAAAPQALRSRVISLIEASAIDVQREERQQAPVAVTGQLRGGIGYVIDTARLTATVRPLAKYAQDVNDGSEPKYVSVKPGTPLRKWADLKGANPYEVQAAIEKRGTKPNPFITRTYNRMKPKVVQDISAGVTKLAEELDRGRI